MHMEHNVPSESPRGKKKSWDLKSQVWERVGVRPVLKTVVLDETGSHRSTCTLAMSHSLNRN